MVADNDFGSLWERQRNRVAGTPTTIHTRIAVFPNDDIRWLAVDLQRRLAASAPFGNPQFYRKVGGGRGLNSDGNGIGCWVNRFS